RGYPGFEGEMDNNPTGLRTPRVRQRVTTPLGLARSRIGSQGSRSCFAPTPGLEDETPLALARVHLSLQILPRHIESDIFRKSVSFFSCRKISPADIPQPQF